MIYYIGYDIFDKKLVKYKNAEEADYNSIEWVAIDAPSLEIAVENYDEAFETWQENPTNEPFKVII